MSAPKPLARTDYPKDRAALAAGYRHLADLIESGDCPIPTGATVALFVNDEEERKAPAIARDLMRALGGGRYAKDQYSSNLILKGMAGGLPVDVWLPRDEVCKRVVVATEEVTEVIPAVTEADLRPEQTITRTVEQVEWRCGSVLDAASETADAIEVSA